MTVYVENPKECTELMSSASLRIQDNIQKSIVFLYITNRHVEIKN